MMKKISLIILCSAFTVFGMAQSTETKTETKQTTEVNMQATEQEVKTNEVVEQPKKTPVKLDISNLQNRDLILKQKNAMIPSGEKKESAEIQQKKKPVATPTNK